MSRNEWLSKAADVLQRCDDALHERHSQAMDAGDNAAAKRIHRLAEQVRALMDGGMDGEH